VRFRTGVIAAVLMVATGAAAEDPRTEITLPAEVRAAFMEHMRDHMDALDDVMVALSDADFKEAAETARERLVRGSGRGFGRYLPIEFREMGLGMHRAAAEFADVADAAAVERTAADWKETMAALQVISAHCRACHSAFRIQCSTAERGG